MVAVADKQHLFEGSVEHPSVGGLNVVLHVPTLPHEELAQVVWLNAQLYDDAVALRVPFSPNSAPKQLGAIHRHVALIELFPAVRQLREALPIEER